MRLVRALRALRTLIGGALVGAGLASIDGAILGASLADASRDSRLETCLAWAGKFALGGAVVGAIAAAVIMLVLHRLTLYPPDERE
jgi:hypothetical protein